MRRGEVKERFDAHFHLPEFKLLVSLIKTVRCVALGEVTTLSSETWDQNSHFSSEVFPYIEISAVELGTNEYNIDMIPLPEAPSRAKMIVRQNDIIVSTTRPHRGAIAMVRPEHDGYIASTGFAILRGQKNNSIRLEFLFNVLSSSLVLRQFLQRSSGGNYPAITADEVEKVLVPLPSLDIQNKLVADLEAARASRKRKLAEADALLAGIDGFLLEQLRLEALEEDNRQVFAIRLKTCLNGRVDALYYAPRFIKLTKALAASPFTNVPLGEITPEIAGGATPTRGNIELYADGGVKFLRILNVIPFEINLEDVKYVQDAVHEGELGRSQLAANDVLMTITGRVGTAAVVSEEILPANINQHIVRLRIKRNDCLPDYLAAYLNSSIGIALSNRGVTGGTRIALDYETIRNLQIPLPPMLIQQSIAAEITRRREEARRLRAEAAKEWEEAKGRFERELLGKYIRKRY